ncbi:MAG: hypothetical protein RSF40_02085 [Oscillospiraceae bacterium]
MPKGKLNNPNFKNTAVNATPSEIGEVMKSCMFFYGRPIVQTDEEAGERIIEYFQWCADNNSRPVWEELCMALGTTRQTVNRWEHKQLRPNSALSDLIKNAKAFMATFDAKMASEGKLDKIVYMFRAKNYYGMVDNKNITVSPAEGMLTEKTPEQIASEIDVELLQE